MKGFFTFLSVVLWLVTLVILFVNGLWIWAVLSLVVPPLIIITSFFASPILGVLALAILIFDIIIMAKERTR